MSMKRYDAGFHTDKVHPHVTGIFVLYTDAEQLERVADEMAEKFREVINVCDRNTELFAQAKEALASYAKWKEK